jgi:uncharacterized RDD family membrane protein YckC
MDWFYAHDGQQVGPVTESALSDLARTGVVAPETLVWHAGMPDWQPYRTATAGFAGAAPTGEQLRFCNSCGKQFPLSDLALFGESAVCADCKPAYVQRLSQGMTSTAPPLFHYAGFWIRVVAVFIDSIIVGALRYAITIPLGLEGLFRQLRPGLFYAYFSSASLIGTLLGIAYYVYFWTQHGATPGKMALGLKVVRPDGSPISVGQAVGRYFCYILDSIILCIGFAMAGWDPEKRCLHDRLCDTRVIRTR